MEDVTFVDDDRKDSACTEDAVPRRRKYSDDVEAKAVRRKRVAIETLRGIVGRQTESTDADVATSEAATRPAASGASHGGELTDNQRMLVAGKCECIQQLEPTAAARIADDLLNEDLGAVLLKHYGKCAGDAANKMAIWAMPFVVPFVIMQECIDTHAGPFADAVLAEASKWKNRCQACRQVQIAVETFVPASVKGVDEGVTVRSLSVTPVLAPRPPKRPKRTKKKTTTTSPPSIPTTALVPGAVPDARRRKTRTVVPRKPTTTVTVTRVSVAECTVPSLLLASLFRACATTKDYILVINTAPRWIARAARIYAPSPRVCRQPKEPVEVTPLEVEFMRLELCYKILACFDLPPVKTESGQTEPTSLRVLLDLARLRSPADGWAGMNRTPRFRTFAELNSEILDHVDVTCHLLAQYVRGLLPPNGAVLKFFSNLHAAVSETLGMVPHKRVRTTRIGVHAYEELTIDAARERLERAHCFGGAASLRECARKLGCQCTAYAMDGRSLEDVASLAAQGRWWAQQGDNAPDCVVAAAAVGTSSTSLAEDANLVLAEAALDEHARAEPLATRCAADPDVAGTAALPRVERVVASVPTLSSMHGDGGRRFYAVQGPGTCYLVGATDDLEKLRKLNTCIMWAGDKVPTRAGGPRSPQPFPALLRMLEDGDDQLAMQALGVLGRAIAKRERKASAQALETYTARHARLFALTVHKVFGDDLRLIRRLLWAAWCMPREYYTNRDGRLACLACRPATCRTEGGGAGGPKSYMRPSHLLDYAHCSVHGNLLVGLLAYCNPDELSCDNVTLSALIEFMSEHPCVAERHAEVSRWLLDLNDSAWQRETWGVLLTDTDVPVTNRAVADALYELCRDSEIDRDIRVALFCNLHPRQDCIEFPAQWERDWEFPQTRDFEFAAAAAPDEDYAARAIVEMLADAVTRPLVIARGEGKVRPERYSAATTESLFVPRTVDEERQLADCGDGGGKALPLSHSKDQLLPVMPNHERILLAVDTPSEVTAFLSSCRIGDVGSYSETGPFLGRHMPTPTSDKCRWCLRTGYPDEALLRLAGCDCDGTRLGRSHSLCLDVLAQKGRYSRYMCCVCHRKHHAFDNLPDADRRWSPPNSVPADGPCTWDAQHRVSHHPNDDDDCFIQALDLVPDECVLETFNTVQVYVPYDKLPRVSCAKCSKKGVARIWVYMADPVCLRFDFCSAVCLKCFERTCSRCQVMHPLTFAAFCIDEKFPRDSTKDLTVLRDRPRSVTS